MTYGVTAITLAASIADAVRKPALGYRNARASQRFSQEERREVFVLDTTATPALFRDSDERPNICRFNRIYVV